MVMVEHIYITIMNKLFDVKDGKLFYAGFDLVKIAEEYQTPLKICFLDLIKERVETLKSSFKEAIKANNYRGQFYYLNANKANYGMAEIVKSYESADGLETSSHYDLVLTKKIVKDPNKYIVSNGYKMKPYVDEIISSFDQGQKIIDVIDDLNEYKMLKNANRPIEVGVRIHVPSAYEEGANDRFGLNDEDLDYILKDLKNTKLILKMVHFHQRGFDYVEELFEKNFCYVFENYYVKIAKLYNTVDSFNMGGGTPLPIDGEFDYLAWADKVIKLLKNLAKKHNVKEPNIFSENGKYSQKDATVTIYKSVGTKATHTYPWKLLNGSLLIAMPEHYALGEPIKVEAINGLDQPKEKVCLGGITCDCDDVYFDHALGYIEMPKLDEFYVALLGTGSYQNSMNGKRGVHHCLLPEERDLLVETVDGKLTFKIRHELQSIDEIIEIM